MQIERASSHFSNLIASVTRKFLIRLRGNFVPAARSLPILVGIAILAATLVLWQGLIAQEQGAIEQEIQLQATNSKIAIADDLQEVTQALVRMVKRWEHQGKPSKEDWEADAALYIQHYGTFQAISWTDPSSYVRWIVPLAGNEAALNLNVASEPKRRIALEAARNKGMAVFTPTIDLQQGGKGFLVYVPIGAGQNFSGFIVGVFRTQQFFNNIFKDLDKPVGRKYAVSIFDGNEEIYSHYLNNRLNEKKWVKQTTINFNGLTWRMQLCPEPELLAQEQYFLEELLLIGGLVMAFLLSLAIALVQSRQRRLKIIDAANQQLTHEIAERHRVEEVLRESQSQLQDFFDNANDLIQSVSLDDGHLIYVNHAWHKTLGYSQEEINRLSIFDLIHPDQLSHCMEMFKSLQAGTEELRIETIFLAKDGTEIAVEGNVNCQVENGKPKTTRGIFRDITKRKQIEAALQQQREWLEVTLSSIGDAVIATDTTAGITFMNPVAEALTGWTAQAAVGQDINAVFRIVNDHTRQAVGNPVEYSLRNGVVVDLANHTILIAQDGKEIPIDTSCAPIRSSSGTLHGAVLIFRDISKRKIAEQEIRNALVKEKELVELKSRFVSMTSHEFRNPLTTIMGSAELLEHYSHKWSDEKKRSHIHRIQATVKQMTQLLNDLLLIGKAEAGKVEFNPAPLDLEQFCLNLVEELQVGVISEHTITFVSQCRCLEACMDEKLLRHIFSNLLSNAIKYSPAGGTVRFELACQEGEAIFQIQDEGIGIPPEDQQRLFESFHRATNVGQIEGTGLGLAIVKKSVDLHDGKIAMNSEVGAGTTFTVKLPVTSSQR